jgi:hypothetical protein
LLFKLPLVADTGHGSRISGDIYSGKQCFDQCWPASGWVLSLRVIAAITSDDHVRRVMVTPHRLHSTFSVPPAAPKSNVLSITRKS